MNIGSIYRVDRILPQIFTASDYVNMKHVLKQMQYRFAVSYETLRTGMNIKIQNTPNLKYFLRYLLTKVIIK